MQSPDQAQYVDPHQLVSAGSFQALQSSVAPPYSLRLYKTVREENYCSHEEYSSKTETLNGLLTRGNEKPEGRHS